MRRKKIGTMDFHGSVDITDPCYDRDVWCRMTDVKIRKGVYTCIAWHHKDKGSGYTERRRRHMSVSDIVWMEDIGYWFCDSIGFRQIKFEEEKCCWRKFDG